MAAHKKPIPAGGEAGAKYGMLTVIGVIKSGRKAVVEVQCECGAKEPRMLHSLKKTAGKGTNPACKKCCSERKSEAGHKRFKIENYIDRRFGRLIVTGYNYDPERSRPKTWLVCMCDCGGQTVLPVQSLMQGHTSSCGCLHSESMSKIGSENIKHGHTTNGVLNGHTPLYRAWNKIRAGVREGIKAGFHKVCHEYDPRWEDYDNFLKDFGDILPSQTISRINNQEPWSKDNCFINIGRRADVSKLSRKTKPA